MPLVKRLDKGSELTHQEMDDNLQYLADLALAGSSNPEDTMVLHVLNNVASSINIEVFNIDLTQEIKDHLDAVTTQTIGVVDIFDDYDGGKGWLEKDKRRYFGKIQLATDGAGAYYLQFDRIDTTSWANLSNDNNTVTAVGETMTLTINPQNVFNPSVVEIDYTPFPQATVGVAVSIETPLTVADAGR